MIADNQKNSAEDLKISLSSLPVGVAILNNELIIRENNQQWQDILREINSSLETGTINYKYPELLAKVGCSSKTIKRISKEINRVLNQEKERYTTEIRCEREELVQWFEVKINRFQDGVIIFKEDISVKKNRAKEMHQTLDEYKKILNNTEEVIWSYSWPDLKVEYISPAVKNIYGYTLQEFEDNPDLWAEVIQSAGKKTEKIKKDLKKRLLQEEVLQDEYRIKKAGGDIIWVNNRVKLIKDAKGNPIRVDGIIKDITKRKKAEKELEKTKNQLEAILESIQDGISVLTPGLTVEYANHAMKDWYKDNLPLEGKKCYQVYRNRDKPCIDCPTLRCVESGEVEVEVVPGLEGSETKYLELFAYPMIDQETGLITGVVEFVRDITQRKEVDRKLEMTKFFLDNADMMVFRVTPAGKILYTNQRVRDKLGYSVSEMENMNVENIIVKENFIERSKFWEKIKTNESISYEQKFVSATGKTFPVNIVSQYFHYDGEEYEFVFARDITERKEREKELRYISYHDDLTGLYNRSFLQEEMERLDTKRQLPISLIMIDVNGMKIVNDTYGHKKGDELLMKVADILSGSTRAEDIVVRWAGDEFIILLPQTERKMAENITRRITQNCQQANFGDIPISAGIGIAVKKDVSDNLKDVLTEADKRMYKNKLEKSSIAEKKLVKNMLNTLADKSTENKGHTTRLTRLLNKLGQELKLGDEQLQRLSSLATMHDIGMITITEKILSKPSSLTEEEIKIIRAHPEKGYNLASATEEFSPLAKAILHHHEHWDGSGYPEGLKEEEIPLLARVFAIVDAYEAMVTGRPYKQVMSNKEALKEIETWAGRQFDPELAKIFVELLNESKDC